MKTLLTRVKKLKVFWFIISILLFISIFQFLPFKLGFNASEAIFNEASNIVSQTKIDNETITNITVILPSILLGKVSIEHLIWENDEIPINRLIIYSTIYDNPGITFRELQRITKLANGVIQYHLMFLQDSDIEYLKLGRCKHFFDIKGSFTEEEKLILSLKQNQNVASILKVLLKNNGNINQKQLAEETGISKALTSYYIKTLKEQKIIEISSTNKLLISDGFNFLLN